MLYLRRDLGTSIELLVCEETMIHDIMPRRARIDAPGALHHIIVRGIERRKIFLMKATSFQDARTNIPIVPFTFSYAL